MRRLPDGEMTPDLRKVAIGGEVGNGFRAEEVVPDLMAKGRRRVVPKPCRARCRPKHYPPHRAVPCHTMLYMGRANSVVP